MALVWRATPDIQLDGLDGPPQNEGLPPAAEPPQPESRQQLHKVIATEVTLVGVIVIVVALLMRVFVAQAFYIPSESMVPQFHKNDRIIVSKLSYRLHDPRRGDIVVFEPPPRAVEQEGQKAPAHYPFPVSAVRWVGVRIGLVQPSTDDFVKRVVALPGETVSGHDGHVFINGRQLEEPYLPDGVATSDFPPTLVPPGQLWVMGDNRGASFDSRFWGTLPISNVAGRAIVKVWPVRDISFL